MRSRRDAPHDPRPRAWPAVACLALLLATAMATPAAGQPEGRFAISPGRLELPAAQQGETYLRKVQVQNGFGTPSTITVTAWGSGLWATADPPSGFTIPANQARDVTLAIAVPAGQGPGAAPGWVNFTTEPKSSPAGGTGVRFGAALALDLTVGGEAVERLAWLSADIQDAAVGERVHATVRVRNEGNVRATAVASGTVLPFASGADAPSLADATGSRQLRPGEEADVAVDFPAGLAAGQYRARLRGGTSLDEVLTFKVLAPGEAAPDGELRSLRAEGDLRAGQAVTLVAVFANTGSRDVAAAAFHGEVLRGGQPLEALASLSSPAAAGEGVELRMEWTPEAAGAYVLRGSVAYDGYQTLPNEALLTVQPAEGPGAGAGGGWPWWILLLVVAAALLLILWAWRRGREGEREPRRPRG